MKSIIESVFYCRYTYHWLWKSDPMHCIVHMKIENHIYCHTYIIYLLICYLICYIYDKYVYTRLYRYLPEITVPYNIINIGIFLYLCIWCDSLTFFYTFYYRAGTQVLILIVYYSLSEQRKIPILSQ